jgi:hypothetical protein
MPQLRRMKPLYLLYNDYARYYEPMKKQKK